MGLGHKNMSRNDVDLGIINVKIIIRVKRIDEVIQESCV